MARGFQQRHGTDYGETFAPSVKYETISTIAAHHIWPIRHLNVQTSFLNGVLQEKVYMQQHLGFVVVGREREVCRLKRMLYDLRQSPHACYHRIDLALCAKGLQRNNADFNLYIARLDGKILLLILYVNDIYLTRTNSPLFSDLATSLIEDFAMTDLGLVSKYLGVHFACHQCSLFLHQETYTLSILEEFSFLECWPKFIPFNEGLQLHQETGIFPIDVILYKRIVGKLRYPTRTRLDIAFTTN